MSDHYPKTPFEDRSKKPNESQSETANPLILLDNCLAMLPEDAPERTHLYKIRHVLLQDGATLQQREIELKKLSAVIEKLTAPANRIGTLLELQEDGMVRIIVGGGEYCANIDPRLAQADLKIGQQILVNEAYTVIKLLGYDRNGPIVRLKEILPDGRLRIDYEPGRPGTLLLRGPELATINLRPGDDVRLDASHRIAIEKIDARETQAHVLSETPTVTWKQIGGQQEAIIAIRRAIEYPLLHAETFARYRFSQPKGFLLHGPPGCGKTLIGQAAANGLATLVRDAHALDADLPARSAQAGDTPGVERAKPPITGGTFLHVKGPEVLNMWVGESERIIRELFTEARERRKAGLLPFLFIDEAESILGTRRALRSYNISNTLVPMFCAELDGVESLQDVVIILASNRPDLIDPAVLRPGRIDRKIKVARPGREEAVIIARIYITDDLPFDRELLNVHPDDPSAIADQLAEDLVDQLFRRSDDTRVLTIRLRNGKRETLYRSDLVSGAILASIVRRAKERAIDRAIQGVGTGITREDLLISIEDEYREGEILPPDDSSEEWLKLLDHHPEQVVSLSPCRKGRPELEFPIGNII